MPWLRGGIGESSWHWESNSGGNGSDPCCALRAAVPAQVKVAHTIQASAPPAG